MITREVAVGIPSAQVPLRGRLAVPDGAHAVVVFAHGSGSSRDSPRNQYVADVLGDAGMGTLLFDLLTPLEEADRANVFDIGMLAGRLTDVTRWLRADPAAAGLPVGYFGASTGAAAALWAAADPGRGGSGAGSQAGTGDGRRGDAGVGGRSGDGEDHREGGGAGVAAIVSRGGRPDLAGRRLTGVRAPTLLIVGGEDTAVLELNYRAQEWLRACESRVVVVPGAAHLFAEPGALEAVAALARGWFTHHLAPVTRTTSA